MNRQNVSRTVLAIAAAALAGPAEHAFAARPFATEDAAALEPGACEVESYAAFAASRPDPVERGAALQAGCGVGLNTQLSALVAHFKSGEQRHTLAGIVGKTALRPLTETEAGFTVAYSSKGIRLPGSGMRREESTLSLVVTVPWQGILLHANLGAVHTESDKRTVAGYALAIERVGEGGFDFGLEVFGQGSDSPWIGAGARYALLPQKLFVDASFAVQSSGERNRQLTVGVKYAF
jgi:hypothetical protein